MRSIHTVIAGNSLAIMLTIVCVLPIAALVAFSATAPLDDATASLGLWLHDKYGRLPFRMQFGNDTARAVSVTYADGLLSCDA